MSVNNRQDVEVVSDFEDASVDPNSQISYLQKLLQQDSGYDESGVNVKKECFYR